MEQKMENIAASSADTLDCWQKVLKSNCVVINKVGHIQQVS